jgi:HK97 family phage prohead protease
MKVDKFDFSGYATKNNLLCSDGRVILPDAFKGNNGKKVPLVWSHMHEKPSDVLGYAILEHRADGTYVYGIFNDTPDGETAKKLVLHGDITNLSIYANQLKEDNKRVAAGNIREVSLVMAGANPGAFIDNVISISHEDGSEVTLNDEAVIFTDSAISLPEVAEPVKEPEKGKEPVTIIKHADTAAANEETVGDVFDTLSDKQKEVVYAIIAEAVDSANGDAAAQSDENSGGKVMKHNVFDKDDEQNTIGMLKIEPDDFKAIMHDAMNDGSLKKAFLQHLDPVTYGYENVDYMFPDARVVADQPAIVQRKMEWVVNVMTKTFHTPFSRIKTLMADITADVARAKGYVTKAQKDDQVYKILKRTTVPTTIYAKQKLDRDDVVDITDFDVVVFTKALMRVLLDEETARAVLIGDGRAAEHADKIDEDRIRPIYGDDEAYSYSVPLAEDADAQDAIEAVIRARKDYNGSGSPTLYCTQDFLTDMLLLKDSTGRRLYNTKTDLATALLVSEIVEVPVMAGMEREIDGIDYDLLGIVVNLRDYTIGADKGGAVNFFDDFDIDYNQLKYLMETRLSGALSVLKSAMIIERAQAAG